MAYHFDPDTLEIDYAAIEADAQRQALANVETYRHLSYDQAYDRAYERFLDIAQGHVESRRFVRERDAALAAMPAREQRIFALREAAHMAPMIDDTPRALAEQAAAERELAALLAEAA